MREGFHRFAARASVLVGSAWAFAAALAIILVWALCGPVAHFSNTWQLIINTGTTIITFLMVFLIQHTQNRDATALHLKLDELLRAVGEARTELVDLEHLPEAELERLQRHFAQLRQEAP